jgi:hypothetical protein
MGPARHRVEAVVLGARAEAGEGGLQDEALALHAAAADMDARVQAATATTLAIVYRRSGHAAAAQEALRATAARLPADAEHNWLRMEAAWTEVLVRSELVAQAATAGLLPERDTQLAAARDLCVRAEPWLPYAPVNGPELLQDCLRLSGAAADVPSWFRWADGTCVIP